MALISPLPRIEEHRVPVVFDCPDCGAKNVRGMAFDLRETLRLNYRVPMWGWSTHWVRCSHCQAELHANCKAEDFQGRSPTDVNLHVRAYLPLPSRVLAIISLATGWAPIVGVLVALCALAANFRTRGWPRWVSVGALALATATNVGFVAVLWYLEKKIGTPLNG